MLDLNTAETQTEFDVIPENTIAVLAVKVRAGGAGDGGWLRRSKDGLSEGLDLEFVVVDGPYAKWRFWILLTTGGTTEGHKKAAAISASTLRAMVESARGIRPDDKSEAGQQARKIHSYSEVDGLRVIAKIGVVPAKDNYPAKNKLRFVITPDKPEWHPVPQVAKPAAAQAAPTAAPASAQALPLIKRPSWGDK